MRKHISSVLAVICLMACGNLWGQTVFNSEYAYDAYRFSQQFYEGTARSLAMGNATVALGGDLGAVITNPAAIGVYRYHEFTITPSITSASARTNYLGQSTNDNNTRIGISNFGYVASFATGRRNSGLINWNLAVTYNKTNNYTLRMSAAGRTNQSSWLGSKAQSLNNLADKNQGIYAPSMDMNYSNDPFYSSNATWNEILSWNTSLLDTLPDSPYYYIAATENINGLDIVTGGDLDQYFMKESIGNTSEAVINFGGNFSNKLFFGVNLGITSLYYKYSEVYSERAVNSNQFDSQFRDFTHYFNYRTSGTGVNLKAGLIYLPVAGLRLGASISTPTWMFLYEEWDEQMTANFADGYSQHLSSPLGSYNYRLNTPFRWNIGAAYTFGQLGAISIDYENVNYSRMRLAEDSQYASSYDTFADTNSDIKQSFKSSSILRAGVEFNVSPQFAVRGGFQHYTSGYKYDDTTVQVGSLGIGYTSKGGFFADLTYQQQFKNQETFQLYDDITDYDGSVITAAPVGTNEYGKWKMLLSVGFRF